RRQHRVGNRRQTEHRVALLQQEGGQVTVEKMLYRDACPALETATAMIEPRSGAEATNAVVSTDWREGLPVLNGRHVALRELKTSDAQSLFALLTAEEVSRFISPPPSTVEAFERFIAWTIRQRSA